MALEIRLERPADYREVENLTREAFWNVYAPGADEHYLAHMLRYDPEFIPALDFVAEDAGAIVGNIMYSKAWIESPDGAKHDVILFGPLSVLPTRQKQGIGGALVRYSAAVAQDMAYRAILIYGSPDYYSRLGFRPASDFGILTHDGHTHPALQVLPLHEGALDGISGRFHEAPVFQSLQPEKVAAFDAQFPPKEKLSGTESQRAFQRLVEDNGA